MLNQTIVSVEIERVGLPSHPEPRTYLIISQQNIFDDEASNVTLSKAYINLDDEGYEQLLKSWVAGVAVREVKLAPSVYNENEESRRYAKAVDSVRAEWVTKRHACSVQDFLASHYVAEVMNEYVAYIDSRMTALGMLPFCEQV